MNATQRNLCELMGRGAIRDALNALAPETVKALALDYIQHAVENGMRAEYVAHNLNVDGIEAARIVALLERG